MDRLNERERQVAGFAATGESNKHIAYRLGLATSTIATHLGAVYRKLGVKNRAQLARMHAVLPVNELLFSSAKLTAAEREVAEQILEGASNAKIAARRNTSVRTVANQVASLLVKLRVRSRAELTARFVGAAPARD